MKEHSLFLMAGFPTKNSEHVEKADWYREQFEDLLREVVELSDGMVGRSILESGEVITDYTKNVEKSTSCLTGISIDSSITERSSRLSSVNNCRQSRSNYSEQRSRQDSCGNRQRQHGSRYSQYDNRQRSQCNQVVNTDTREEYMNQKVRTINDKALELVQGLIRFKEDILRDVNNGRLYTVNYPSLIEHIMREAKLYRETIAELNEKGDIRTQDHQRMEQFWNQIMMEHALFVRGLLDPSEEELVRMAHEFSVEKRWNTVTLKPQEPKASLSVR